MSGDPRDHILATALKLVGEQGMARTSMADIASGSGVSRATVYRYFPGGKDEVMESMVAWEQFRFLERLRDAVDDAPDLESLCDRALLVAKRQVDSHEQLQRVLASEPERLFAVFTRTGARMTTLIARYLLRRLRDSGRVPSGVDAVWLADELARSFFSYVGSPGPWDLEDPDHRKVLVTRYLLAGIR
jgi:AcrR family transcriptional regulator